MIGDRQTVGPDGRPITRPKSQLVFGDLIFLRDQLLLFLLQLDVSPKHINRRRRPGAFLVGGAVVDGLVGFHLRP